MARYELFTSIDIGTRSVKAATVGKKGEGLELLAYAIGPSRGIEGGDIKDVIAFKESLGAVLDELERQFMRVYDSEFIVSFSSDSFDLQEVREEVALSEGEEVLITEDTVEDIKEKVLRKISGPDTGREVYHMFTKRYLLNGNRLVFSPIDMRARSLTMELVAVSNDYSISESIRSTVSDIIESELNLMASPISAAEGVLTSTEKDSGVVVIELGHNFTTVIAYVNSIPIGMTMLPLGIKNVIKDIASVFGTSFDEAERLLRTRGVAMLDITEESPEVRYKALDGVTERITTLQNLASVIHARLREILNKARRVYKSFENRIEEFRERGIPGGVVLTGGGAKINRIEDLAASVFKSSVGVGSYSRSSPLGNPDIIGDEEALGDPIFSPVFGNIVTFMKKYSSPVEFAPKKRTSGGLMKKIAKFFKNLL